MSKSLQCTSRLRWTRWALPVLLQCLLGAAARADVTLGLVIPGYDSDEHAALSDSLLDSADIAIREGHLDAAFDQPVRLLQLDNGCDSQGVADIADPPAGAARPNVVLGDCGDKTIAVAKAYAHHGLPFVMPFAQDWGNGNLLGPDVTQVELGGMEAAQALVTAINSAGRTVDGRVAVLTEPGSFGTGFYHGLVDEGLCVEPCQLQSVPWPQEDTPVAVREADWVIYAGRHVESLEPVIERASIDQHWVIHYRAKTVAAQWQGFLNVARYLPPQLDVILTVPDIRRLEWATQGVSSEATLYFLAAIRAAAGHLVVLNRSPGSGGLFNAIGRIFGGVMREAEAPTPRKALAVYTPDDYPLRFGRGRGSSGAVTVDVVVPPPTTAPEPSPEPSPEPEVDDPVDPPEPVYNLEITPLAGKSPIALEPGSETTLSFSLGPELRNNVLRNARVNPDIREIADGQLLKLGITLNCLVCATGSYQRHTLDYDPQQGRSIDPARFKIVPDASRTDPVTGKGLLLFTVDAKGIDLDVIQVGVFVGEPTAEQAEAWKPPTVRPVRYGTIVDEDAPDLVIDVASAAGLLPVTLIPYLPELRAELENTLDGSHDGAWTYESGVTKADLDDLVRDAYLELRTMAEQHEGLKAYFAGLGREPELSAGAARLDLNETDRAAMLDPLRRHGARIYDRVFIRGDRQLREGIRLLNDFEAPGGRPLRVVFRVANSYVPWQLLYPRKTGEIDVESFWGFRYEMGTRQLLDAAQATLLTRMDKPTSEQTLFAAYRSSGSDDVAARANLFARNVDDLLPMSLDIADSRDEFLQRLTIEGYKLRLIIAYGHASSGTVIESSSSGRPLLVSDVGGPRFAFAESEFLEPGDIDDHTPPPDEGLLLEGQPLVIFNACETGGGGLRPMNNNGFVGALTRAGARAVIVTETPVWNNFAYHFGRDVFEGLVEGLPVSTALRNARRTHLHEWNNPLGLIYTLYGNPAARME